MSSLGPGTARWQAYATGSQQGCGKQLATGGADTQGKGVHGAGFHRRGEEIFLHHNR
jgi:hypothetical protein